MHNCSSDRRLSPVCTNGELSLDRCAQVYGKTGRRTKGRGGYFELIRKPAWDPSFVFKAGRDKSPPRTDRGKVAELIHVKLRRNRSKVMNTTVESTVSAAQRQPPKRLRRVFTLKGSMRRETHLDWADSAVYRAAMKESPEFNSEGDPSVFYESELAYVSTMLAKDEIEENLCQHLWEKAKNTIRRIAEEVMNPSLFVDMDQRYPTVSPESAGGLVEACKDLMGLRKELVTFFRRVVKRDVYYEYCLSRLQSSAVGNSEEREKIMAQVAEMQALTEGIVSNLSQITNRAYWLKDPLWLNKRVCEDSNARIGLPGGNQEGTAADPGADDAAALPAGGHVVGRE